MSHEVMVEIDVPTEMRDGVGVPADIYPRPATEGRWPVLLTRMPYGKHLPASLALVNPIKKVQNGFIVNLHSK
ncbi:CocE/NonD family hydrolase [Rhodococcus erythropolis]|uniref:CocE/NonD family hydrolase n=1 Tax=Rhodococcus erythropolis TaxID=1833 RepID=UPI0029498DE9|nr:CocE/NonD family hydrolase [Rhodococcus erythropolis]MDV6212798.1 CocE/NonD family hydrolase [Rhodococcus erythropolis]